MFPIETTKPWLLAANSTHIYWAPYGGSTVWRANLDGSEVEEVLTASEVIEYGLAVDEGHIYWGNYVGETIGRANLDGSEQDDAYITEIGGKAGWVESDETFIYWENGTTGEMGRVRVDRSEQENAFLPAETWPFPFEVTDQHIYWNNWKTGQAYRSDLDGSQVTELFTWPGGFKYGYGLAVDSTYIYGSTANAGKGFVFRTKLDGSALKTFIPDLGEVGGVLAQGGYLYWADYNANEIERRVLLEQYGRTGLFIPPLDLTLPR